MVSLIIPVRNGGSILQKCVASIEIQSLKPSNLLVMDSCSSDESVAIVVEAGFKIEIVPEGTFDHGGTRARAVELVDDDIVVFMTQDAVLASQQSLEVLVAAFDDPTVVAAYGRQLPHDDADPIAAFTRRYNYGNESYVTEMNSVYPKGIRKAYMSNSFAAYRRSVLLSVGNFENGLIFGEDMFAAGRMLKAGHRIAYVAEATVRHSHNYSIREEFSRYFDIGVFHATNSWLLEDFGKVESEGAMFAVRQLTGLVRSGSWRYLPGSVARSAAKYLGYKLGAHYVRLGPRLSRRLAMHKGYFFRQ